MSRMKNQFEFTAGVYYNNELFFNKYNLMIDFFNLGDTSDNQNVALDRISYFIYDVMQRSIFIQEDDIQAMTNFAKAGVPVLSIPGIAPVDPLVLGVMMTKMNAIIESVLIISDAEMSSYVGSGIQYVWDSSDEDDEVQAIIDTDDPAKWWNTVDPRFASYEPGVDVKKLEADKPYPMTWDMLQLAWHTESDDIAPEPSDKNGTVIKADFTGK